MIDSEFQQKINRSRWIEKQILTYYTKNIDPKAKFPAEYETGYDIVCEKVENVEVKEDIRAIETGNYVFEYEDFKGEPSGIEICTAGQFVIVDAEFVIIFDTKTLKYLLSETKNKRRVNMGYQVDRKGAGGWLIERTKILCSPYANVLPKWF